MFNLVSIMIGVGALTGALVGFIPLLGWLNWFVIPLAAIGLAFGAVSDGRAGRNLNLVVIVIAVLRLMIGGGLF
jgi:hypothetical protein